MKIIDCKDCKWVLWMVGIGQGVRCDHPKNNKEGDIPIIISRIPKGCEYKTVK